MIPERLDSLSIIIFDERILRFTQAGGSTNGKQVRAFELDILTTVNYREHEINESPILKASGFGSWTSFVKVLINKIG